MIFISIGIAVSRFFFVYFFLFVENFFEEFNENNGRVEMEENCQRKCHPLDDQPWHETEEISFNQIGFHLKNKEHFGHFFIWGNFKITLG